MPAHKGLTSHVGCLVRSAFEPLFTGTLLAALIAPTVARDRLLSALHLRSPRAISRLLTGLELLVAVGTVFKLNRWLSDRVLNNWVVDETWEWEKEVAVVTGGSQGIGADVVRRLAERGMKIIILDIQPPKSAIPPNVVYYECDVASSDTIAKVSAEIRTAHGDPTILINNAGIGHFAHILDLPDREVRKTFDVNILSNFALVREFLPAMIKNNHGHVIGIASIASFLGIEGIVPYCCTKAAMLAFYEGLRQEVRCVYNAPKVRISTIHPSWTQTNMVKDNAQLLKDAGMEILPVEVVGTAVVDHVLSGKSGRVVVPPGLEVAAGMRGWPMWVQEIIRGSRRSTTVE